MTSLSLSPYSEQEESWPKSGQSILAQYNSEYVVVYQAFNKDIANYAVEHQIFGGPKFSENRMTWIKPNFMWMMYRSGWGTKDPNQSNILAIWLNRGVFETLLLEAWPSSYGKAAENKYVTRERWKVAKSERKVVMQWDPDHGPSGRKLERRAIQIGIGPEMVKQIYNSKTAILKIEDITSYVAEQRKSIGTRMLLSPTEVVYQPQNIILESWLALDHGLQPPVVVCDEGNSENETVNQMLSSASDPDQDVNNKLAGCASTASSDSNMQTVITESQHKE